MFGSKWCPWLYCFSINSCIFITYLRNRTAINVSPAVVTWDFFFYYKSQNPLVKSHKTYCLGVDLNLPWFGNSLWGTFETLYLAFWFVWTVYTSLLLLFSCCLWIKFKIFPNEIRKLRLFYSSDTHPKVIGARKICIWKFCLVFEPHPAQR